MGWFAYDRPENKRKRAKIKRDRKKSSDELNKVFTEVMVTAVMPPLGIGMMLLDGAGKKKKKRR